MVIILEKKNSYHYPKNFDFMQAQYIFVTFANLNLPGKPFCSKIVNFSIKYGDNLCQRWLYGKKATFQTISGKNCEIQQPGKPETRTKLEFLFG